MATIRLGDRIGIDPVTRRKSLYGFSMSVNHASKFLYETEGIGSGPDGKLVRQTEEWKLYIADSNG